MLTLILSLGCLVLFTYKLSWLASYSPMAVSVLSASSPVFSRQALLVDKFLISAKADASINGIFGVGGMAFDQSADNSVG